MTRWRQLKLWLTVTPKPEEGEVVPWEVYVRSGRPVRSVTFSTRRYSKIGISLRDALLTMVVDLQAVSSPVPLCEELDDAMLATAAAARELLAGSKALAAIETGAFDIRSSRLENEVRHDRHGGYVDLLWRDT